MPTDTYKLKPEAYAAIKKRTLIASVIMVVILAIPFFIKYYGNTTVVIDKQKLAIVLILLAILLPVYIIRLLRRQKKSVDDFSLVIDEHTITAYPGMPGELILSRIEVTQIVKNTEGSYLIIGNAGKTVITIPAHIERPEQLEIRLNEFAPVAANAPDSFIAKYFKVILLAVAAMLILFIYITNKMLVVTIGAILSFTFIGMYVTFFRNTGTDAQTRRLKFWLIFITLCIIGKMAYVLTMK